MSIAAIALVALAQGCSPDGSSDSFALDRVAATPTAVVESAATVPTSTAAAVPTPQPTSEVEAIPTATSVLTSTVSPLDDCTGEISLGNIEAEHIVVISTEDAVKALTPEGQFLGQIACARGAGQTTRIDDTWHLLPVTGSLDETNVAFLRLGPETLSVTDVTDTAGAIRRPYAAPTMSRSAEFVTAFEQTHEPMVMDLTSRQMTVPDEIFDFSTVRMEVALDGALVVASTDTGVWLVDPTERSEPRKIASRGPAKVNTAGTHAWFSMFGENGLDLVVHELTAGERTGTVPLVDFVRFEVLGQNALLQTDAGLQIVTVDGNVGPQILGPGFALHRSELATDFIFARQTMPGAPDASVIIAADGSLTQLPELNGLKVHQDFRASDRLVFVDSRAGVVTMIDLSDGSVDTWRLRPRIPFQLVDVLDDGAAVALNLTFNDATILLFENEPTPLQLSGASQVLVDADAGLALLAEEESTSIISIPDGAMLARLEPGVPVAIVKPER